MSNAKHNKAERTAAVAALKNAILTGDGLQRAIRDVCIEFSCTAEQLEKWYQGA